MAWRYSELQEKLTNIQTKLTIKMEQKSNSVDQVMPMKTTNNSLQGGQVLMWNGAQKRKAEDFFVSVENSKNLRSARLMLDMYTQTDVGSEISLKQIYDLLKKNSERMHKVENMVTKLCNMIGAFADSSSPQIAAMTCQEKKSRDSSPVDTRIQPVATHYQEVSANSQLSSSDYVTQVPQDSIAGNWDGAHVRDDDLAMNSSMTESETGLSDVNTIPGKTPPKVNWNCDNSITAEDHPAGIGCWLGDPSSADGRAWFCGDPKIITKCENYGLNPVKLALALTEALFTREEMAASNVRGTRGKESLNPSKIKAIKAHVDHKFPLPEAERMEVRWQLIKPKIDSKCRSQRRQQRENKWKMEKRIPMKPEVMNTPGNARLARAKRLTIGDEEREMLLYGVAKTVVNVYTENNAVTTPFTEPHEEYSPVSTINE